MPPPITPTERPAGPAGRLSVFLLDDHRVFTDLLRLTLEMQDDLICAGVAHTLAEGLATTAAFDVAVIDLHLPDGGGLAAVARFRELRPDARLIVLTAHPRASTAERALADGAAAFLAKDGALADILAAIRGADRAIPMVCPAAREDPAALVRLTPRELDVLRGLAEGKDATRLAAALGITRYTARDHIKSVLAKLDVHSQLDAVVTAGRLGLVELGSPY